MAQVPTDFTKYFKSSSLKKQVYSLDSTFKYSSFEDMQSIVDLKQFFTVPSSVTFSKIDKTTLNDMLLQEDYNVLDTLTRPKTGPVLKSQQLNYVPNTTFTNADEDTVQVNVANRTLDTQSFMQLINNLNSVNQTSSSLFVSDHTKMSNVIDAIVFAVCKWRFDALKATITTALNNSSSRAGLPSAMVTGFTDFVSLPDPKGVTSLTQLINASKWAIARAVKNKSKDYFMMTGVNITSKFSAPVNYRLREFVFQKAIIRDIQQPDDNTFKYAKRLAAEMFLITFYPYLHLQYINQMTETFKNKGDFINMRAAVFTKVMFAVNMLFFVYTLGVSLNPVMNTQQANVLVTLLNILKEYSIKLAQVDFANDKIGLGDVLIRLHDKSAEVVQKSASIDGIKNKIVTNQLQSRGILTNFKEIDVAFRKKRAEFVFLILVFMVLLAVSLTLIVKDIYIDELMFTLLGFIAIIITYKLIMTILGFFQ